MSQDYGVAVELEHPSVVVFLVEMDFETCQSAPTGPMIRESARQYYRAAKASALLEVVLRSSGYGAKQHYDADLKGRLVVTAGLGGMGGAQPLAATMAGASMLAVECQSDRIDKRLETSYLDKRADTLDEALAMIEQSVADKSAVSVGLLGNAGELLPELLERLRDDDLLVITAGPLTGTTWAGTGRVQVAARSPLTPARPMGWPPRWASPSTGRGGATSASVDRHRPNVAPR